MNYHTDEWIMEKVNEHYQEAKELIAEKQIFGIFLQGSQNYGLDTPQSDIDTKLIILPSFDDIVRNRKPISTTHIRANEEHIDMKDIRLYFKLFLKQNMNILEILFTPYCILNEQYADYWECLRSHREEIARYNLYLNAKAMKGVALEKYHALEHPYPSKLQVLEQFGYDPKQLCHLLRISEFFALFTAELLPYEHILYTRTPEGLKEVKQGLFSLDDARIQAKKAIDFITRLSDNFCEKHPKEEYNQEVEELLYTVQYNVLKQSIIAELKEEKND